jgi:2-oxoglutarate dehydrogenase E2 component (dihydrolipoamide succinyltransferase)
MRSVSSSPTDQSAIVEVTMPQMGVSVAEGTILKWHKAVGDRVEADETICEISTDKVDTEIPSPASGRLARILVEVDETVPVGTALAELEIGPSAAKAADGFAEGATDASNGVSQGNGATPDRSHVISPVVRRIASEHGIDLAAIKGTGVGGRIRKRDVLAYMDAGGTAEPVLHTESPYRPEPEAEPATNGHARTADRREPLSPMRRQIAEHMLASRRTAAHVTTVAEIDMTRVVARRAELKEGFASRGVSLTYLAFVARATVAALLEQPILNASLEGDEIVHHDDVNLGIAVALEQGLIVPVIPRAQLLGLEGLAAAVADLSGRARAKKLSPDGVKGGTFTITNPGQFGTVLATPIINQPQVAILDLEAVVKRPAVVEGPQGDSIAIRPFANLCLSFDHRVLDGAEAARFLGTIKARLEGWVDDA